MISQDIIKQIMGDKLGIGFETAKQTTETENIGQAGDSHPNTSNNNGYKERLDSIEQIIKGLQGTVENRLGVIEKGLNSQSPETVRRLKELLQKERERNQDLLRKHAHLETEHLHLKELVDRARKRAQQIRAGKA
jgi:Zn-dependent M16 (insulinase) family peptidase